MKTLYRIYGMSRSGLHLAAEWMLSARGGSFAELHPKVSPRLDVHTALTGPGPDRAVIYEDQCPSGARWWIPDSFHHDRDVPVIVLRDIFSTIAARRAMSRVLPVWQEHRGTEEQSTVRDCDLWMRLVQAIDADMGLFLPFPDFSHTIEVQNLFADAVGTMTGIRPEYEENVLFRQASSSTDNPHGFERGARTDTSPQKQRDRWKTLDEPLREYLESRIDLRETNQRMFGWTI